MPYRVFIRVDLPAPFSPTRACTVPRRTLKVMSELATTPGKRLVMPVSSTAGGTVEVAAGGPVGVASVLIAPAPRDSGSGGRESGRASCRVAVIAEHSSAERARPRRDLSRRGRVASGPPDFRRSPTSGPGSPADGARHGDSAVENARLGLLDVRHVLGDEAARGRIADAVVLQAVDMLPRERAAIRRAGDEVPRRDIDLLEHRG